MTSTGFDEAWAAGAVAQLHAQGVRFASGMTDADLAAVEAHFGCSLPSELSTFLRAGIPVSSKWARWTDDRYGHLFPKLDETLTDRLDDLHRDAQCSRGPSTASTAVASATSFSK